jgi:hypothetical protein
MTHFDQLRSVADRVRQIAQAPYRMEQLAIDTVVDQVATLEAAVKAMPSNAKLDTWSELSPARRLMLETVAGHDGISEHSASLTFKRSDISWALRRKLVEWRPYKDRKELHITEAGQTALAHGQSLETEG